MLLLCVTHTVPLSKVLPILTMIMMNVGIPSDVFLVII